MESGSFTVGYNWLIWLINWKADHMRDPTEICSDTAPYISYNVIKGLALKACTFSQDNQECDMWLLLYSMWGKLVLTNAFLQETGLLSQKYMKWNYWDTSWAVYSFHIWSAVCEPLMPKQHFWYPFFKKKSFNAQKNIFLYKNISLLFNVLLTCDSLTKMKISTQDANVACGSTATKWVQSY